MYKAAVIGDRQSVAGFAALGLSVFYETERSGTAKLIDRLAHSGFAVIYITEAAASAVMDVIEKYKSEALPAIILIPGISGNTGEGMSRLKESVEKAVGTNALN